MAKGKTSSPRRKERRAQLWKLQQERKSARREAGAKAAAWNRELRSEGLPTPCDKWADLKERQKAKSEAIKDERQKSLYRRNLGHRVTNDKRSPALKRAWIATIAAKPGENLMP